MVLVRTRKIISGCIQVARPPEVVYSFIRSVSNLSGWSWFRNIRSIEANLYQADDIEGTCRFFWIEDNGRQRVILQQTQHKDSPTLVVSITGGEGTSQVHSQYSSFRISATQRHQLTQQMLALKKLLEDNPARP
ncbi:MAG: hypothetical protein HYX74_03315 [Acidobacteria bacterium]|nr:hypothetical protein [Acidobacteriota bacterium]